MISDCLTLTAIEAAQKIRKGELTASELIASHIARMDETRHLNAVTTRYDEEALQAAEEADLAVRRGEELGPLHGVPVTIKENIDQKGCSTSNGVKAFAKLIATEDAPLVQRLKRAGAIPIGRTNTPEMSWRFHTDNTLFGPTLNPWNEKLTPGGSSGGAASSLAAGVGCIAHGSDLGGSVRFPAFCCGVLGLRPSHGRIPFYNSSATSERPLTIQLSSSQGPLARSVADIKLSYEVMAGYSVKDTWSLPDIKMPLDYPKRAALFTPPDADPKINSAIERAGQILAEQGYDVETVTEDFIEEACNNYLSVLITEVHLQKELIIDRFGSDQLKTAYDLYTEIVPPLNYQEYARTLALRTHYHRKIDQFQRKYPIILSPVSKTNAFKAGHDIHSVETLKNIMESNVYMSVINFLDLPAMSIPTHTTLEGVPLGIQVIGPRYGEDKLFEIAELLGGQGFIASKLAPSKPELAGILN